MRYPKINRQPRRTVRIPDLSGGMNLRDGLSLINDNQLTDCQNMFFEGGLLKTRPAVLTDVTKETTSRYETNVKTRFFEDIRRAYMVDNEPLEHILAVDIIPNSEIPDAFELEFYFVCSTDISIKQKVGYYPISDDKHFVPFLHQNKLYCIFYNEVYNVDEDRSASLELYAPLIITNAMPKKTSKYEPMTGTMIEGYNLLNSYCRIKYSTVDPDRETNEMRYALPMSLSEGSDEAHNRYQYQTITAEIIDKSGNTYTHKVELNHLGYGFESLPEATDGLYMEAGGFEITFYTDKDGKNVKVLEKDDHLKNNMTVKLPQPYVSGNSQKVTSMTRSMWFGGTSKGINGGTRLFLCGNTEEENSNLVVWSDLNNPFYFPESNYFRVGENSQTVNCFGKQGEALVIFKDREIYQTQYVQGDSLSADEVIDQSVIDITTASAYFPLILINSAIGCDCPDTVQLCRNRLVWLNSDGHIYTLVTQNQYNERSVFDISEMIEKKLKTHNAELLKKATSADWQGKYVLSVDDGLYVLEYNSYGYNFIYSYSKTEDANKQIPWYYWRLPITPTDMIATGDVLLFGICEKISDTLYISHRQYMDGTGNVDILKSCRQTDEYMEGIEFTKERHIVSSFATKLFNFGSSAYTKYVPLINISFANNDGRDITVSYMTERGRSTEEKVVSVTSQGEVGSSQYIYNYQFRPEVNILERIGLCVKCDGFLAVESVEIDYKILGGAR